MSQFLKVDVNMTLCASHLFNVWCITNTCASAAQQPHDLSVCQRVWLPSDGWRRRRVARAGGWRHRLFAHPALHPSPCPGSLHTLLATARLCRDLAQGHPPGLLPPAPCLGGDRRWGRRWVSPAASLTFTHPCLSPASIFYVHHTKRTKGKISTLPPQSLSLSGVPGKVCETLCDKVMKIISIEGGEPGGLRKWKGEKSSYYICLKR